MDMLRELQLIADIVISGMRRGKAGIVRQLRKLRRIASSVEAKRHRWPKAIDYSKVPSLGEGGSGGRLMHTSSRASILAIEAEGGGTHGQARPTREQWG